MHGYEHNLVTKGVMSFLHAVDTNGTPSTPCAGKLFHHWHDRKLFCDGDKRAFGRFVRGLVFLSIHFCDGQYLVVPSGIVVRRERYISCRYFVKSQIVERISIFFRDTATSADGIGNGTDGLLANIEDIYGNTCGHNCP